ncbi:MAG: GNAT family N-acetyltransferase [Defluviitaleaceae bacterium]|nr:GNAT family N-acetyltransferase [Defluviitaleaceae bacterium]
MNLTNGKLTIRNAMPSDAPQLCAWWNDGSIMAHAGFPNGLGTTADDIRQSLAKDTDNTHRRHIIAYDGTPIGEMNYRNMGHGVAEIGIKICDSTQREKGLGTTLLSMFIDALFTYYGYSKIILDTNVKNTRAQHVYEQKLGFTRLRVNQDAWRDQLGDMQASVDYELTKTVWEARRPALPYILIREEQEADHYAVEALTRDAFWKTHRSGDGADICDEHLLVHRLRTSPALVPSLNLVAEMDGKLVGHIIYSISHVVDNAGNSHEMLTFGPLSVLPVYQGKGVGQALMRYSFLVAKELGYRGVIIYGHPGYYPRVGFTTADVFGITTLDGNNFDAFMAYPLYDGALDGIHGRHHADDVFENLTQADARAFDKKFPPMPPHAPVPMDVLLSRLHSPGKEAVQALGFNTLAMLQTKSQGEIAALAGMDESAMEIIRAVMAENNLEWGRQSHST